MKFFDSHAHYDDDKFENDRDELINQLFESGITKIISAGYSLKGSIKSIELSQKYDFIYSTVGISPNDLKSEDIDLNKSEVNSYDMDNLKKDIEEIEKILISNLSLKRIVAIGEIGLDYHYDIDKKLQYEAFSKQINMANKYDLPVVIHTREAVMDTLTMLKEKTVNNKGVFHCCPLNRELVKEALKLGFYISMAGPVTFKNSKNANEIIEMVPLNKILIETDSPYLAPEPVRGTRNDSRNLKYIAQKIADVKGLTIEDVARETYTNTIKCFNISIM